MKEIDYIAVTQGPGLAVALEVGIRKAKELAGINKKKIIAVNHLDGHIYSSFVQNSKGNPQRDFEFPYLTLLVSGGHTELVLFKNHIEYQVVGQTLDDAAGEALDKAARLLGLGYPGGAVIERLAREVNNKDFYNFPRPMLKSNNLNFSFSGLKTSFYYFLKKTSNYRTTVYGNYLSDKKVQTDLSKNIRQLASSFQRAVFDTLIYKTEKAIKLTKINRLIAGGGVIANQELRKRLKLLAEKHNGSIFFPPYKYLTGDNAAMIGVASYYKAKQGKFSKENNLDRIPRMDL